MYNFKRDKDSGTFNWNKVLFQRFDDQYENSTMYPCKGYYKFRNRYHEEPDAHGTAAVPEVFGNLNLTQAKETIIKAATGEGSFVVNSLTPWTWSAHAVNLIAPYGCAEIARMYSNYRVTSVDMNLTFELDLSSIANSFATTGNLMRGRIGFGIWVDHPYITDPSVAQLAEMVMFGKRPLAWMQIDTQKQLKTKTVLRIRNLNILKQFQQDDAAIDAEDTTTFVGGLSSGTWNTLLSTPVTTTVTVNPFIFIDEPLITFGGYGDTAVNIMTTCDIIQHTQLSGPKKKSVDS